MPRSRSRERSRSRSVGSSSSPIRVPPPSPVSPIENKTTTNSITNTLIDGFAWGTGTTIAKIIFSSDQKETKHEVKEVKEVKDKSDSLWVKYNECIEKKDENKNCDKILLEDM